jgi:D-lactate dehydrogenase
MASIVFFELENWQRRQFERKLRGHALSFIEGHLSNENIAKAAEAEMLVLFIYSRVGRAELAAMPKVKMIATMSTGFDHIDMAACKERGVAVCNVPSYGSETVAEHAMALILALSKKILPSVERTRRGDFTLEGLRTSDLQGKKLGIVGLGRIGSHVAKMARSFGMKVLAFGPHSDPAAAKKLRCKLVGLDELLEKSDIVSLHAPLTPQTHHMINVETIAKMKDGAVIINTARGGLVDAKALVAALDSGKISAAGLDVLEEECNIKEEAQLLSPDFAGECDLKTVLANHILLNRPNVIITPHNAFNSTEALQRIVDATIGNIKAHVGGKPENLVG